MKTSILLLAACLAAFASAAQYTAANLFLQPEAVSVKYTWKNMRIYPVLAKESFVKANAKISKYISLGDALKQNKIKITESQDGEEVNKLFAQNTSKDTIILLGGEVISGGKQDRMIAGDMILPPGKGKVDMQVFCVEHGRWTYKNQGASAKSLGFSASYSVASTEVRKAGNVNKDQSKVWEKVKDVTDKNNAPSGTGTYMALATDSVYEKNLDSYRIFFTTVLKSNPAMIGFVAVTGDSILGCDLFASHALLMQHASNVISSYATEAMSNGKKVTVPFHKVKSYTDHLLANEVQQEKLVRAKGTMLKEKNGKVHIAVY